MTKKNNVKVKLIAGMMAVVTATSPILTYAAEMPMAEALNIEQEDGITRIETDAKQETKFLFINLNQGGSVILNKGELDQRRITLEKIDDKIHINVYDKDGILVSSEDAINNKNTYMYEVDADSVITVDAAADKGYEVAAFESKKDNILEETGFVDKIVEYEEKPQEDFSYPVFMNKDTNISVKFKKLEENVTDTEPTDEKEDLIEESKSDAGDESEDIILNDQDTTAQNDQMEGEEATLGSDEATEDNNLAEQTEENLLIQEEKTDEMFLEYDDTYEDLYVKLNPEDFSSARLVVIAKSNDDIVDKEHIISSYNNIYLLQYKSAEQAMNAYVYYSTMVEAVEPDMPLKAASQDTTDNINQTTEQMDVPIDVNATEIEVTETTNPITTLAETGTLDTLETESQLIALIDTGVDESKNVINRISLIDNVLVGNSHGNEMADAIVSQNPDAKIISIRAIGDDGRGTVSSIIAGMEYAIEQGVDIINLSMYAKTNIMSSVVVSEIQKATDAGIVVVGAAGNDGEDATGYIPGSAEAAYIIGAANEEGARIKSSNFGNTVDYNVVGTSTSEATALFTGFVSKYGIDAVSGVLNQGMIYETDYTPNIDETIIGEDFKIVLKDESEYRVDTGKSMHLKIKMMNDALIHEGMTIDSVMFNPSEEAKNAVYADVGFDVPIYKSEIPGKYLIFTDEMYKNGLASGKVMDAIFSNANFNGEVLTEGVYYDKDYNVAILDESIFKEKAVGDYADVQLQLMIPVDVEGGVKDMHISVDNKADFVDVVNPDMHISARPLFTPQFQLVTKESADKITAANLSVYLNGSEEPLSKDVVAYDSETGLVAINERNCMVSDIKIEISPYGASFFAVADTNHTVNSLSRLCYLKVDSSKLPVGKYAKMNAEIYQPGFNFQNTPANTTLWNMGRAYFDHPKNPAGDGSGGDGSMSAHVYFGIPTNAFGLDFQFRKKDMSAYPNWGPGRNNYNQPVRGGCHHTSQALNVGNGIKPNMQVALKVVDKAESKDGYTDIVICVETTVTAYGGEYPQTVGSVFQIAVPSGGSVKIHKKIGYDAYAKSSPNMKLDAVFTIYKDKACRNKVKTVKFDSSKTNDYIVVNGLKPGIYYLKETKPCTGCMPDDTVYKFTAVAGKTTSTSEFINVQTNQPVENGIINNQAYKFSLSLIKEDTKGTKLPGAVFRVQYKEQKGGKLIATWFFKAGDGTGGTKLGEVHYHPNYLLNTWVNPRTGKSYNSSPIITTNGSKYFIPEGWLDIQEVMAPNEDKKNEKPQPQQYKRDSNTYGFELKGTAGNTQNFTNSIVQPPVEKTWKNPPSTPVNEWKVRVQVKKVKETLEALKGAKFGVYYDEECSEPVRDNAYIMPDKTTRTYMITSGADGFTEILTVAAIPEDQESITLYCKELKAPDGYAKTEKPYKLEFSIAPFKEWIKAGKNPDDYVGELKFFGEQAGKDVVWKNSEGWKVNVNAKKIDKNKKPLQGAVFEVFVGEPGEGVKVDEVLTSGANGMTNTITIPVSSDKDKVVITCREKTPPKGYTKTDKIYRLEFLKKDYVKPNGQTKTFGIDDVRDAPAGNTTYEGIVNEQGWEVKLDAKKVDADGKPLEGAVFGVFDTPECDGEPITTMTSGPDGIAGPVSVAVPMDKEEYTVYVKEIQAPEGYMIIDEVAPVTLIKDDHNGKVIHVFPDGLKNDKAAWEFQANVKKVDGDGKPLAGAVIGLYSDKGCTDLIKELTSQADGMTETYTHGMANDVDSITVYCKEISAPEGYVASTKVDKYVFTYEKYKELKAANADADKFHGELHTFFPNGLMNVSPTPEVTPPIGGGGGTGGPGVHVLKKSTASKDIMDLDSYELEGAEFSLTADRADGSSGILITNKDGISNTIALRDNHKEKYHPPIYNQDGELIQEGRTEIIPVTTVYTITETKAPKGHKMNFKPYHFSVTMPADKDRVEEAIFVDEPYFCKNKLEIEKLGVKGNKIEGVVFKVEFFDSTGPDASKLKRTWYLESDANGMIYMDDQHVSKRLDFQSDEFFKHKGEIVIPIDGYLQFTEVAAPAEYVVNDKPFGMETGENANLSKRVYNDMELCEIKIKKYEDDGVTPISGVEFEIKFLEETIKPTADKNQYFGRLLKEGESYISSTDENGELVFKGLDHGKYQITEVRTHSGNTLLKEPIIVTVPMTMTEAEADAYGNIDYSSAKEDVSYTDKWFFFGCLFEITNHATFVVPMTGGNGIWKIGFIGMGVLALIGTGLIVHETGTKKRKLKKRCKKD